MELESEISVIESVEDNEVIIPSENNLIHSNGACSDEHVREIPLGDMKSEGFHSSPSGSIGTTSGVKKGHGLRKWKRIQRESSKERGNSLDNGVVGKRGFSNATPDSRKAVLSAEMKQRSEGSVSSTNGVVKSSDLFADGFDTGLAVGLNPIFAAVTDSENSEDRSSKSSTAASAPRQRSKISVLGGYMGDNNGIISYSEDFNSAALRGQQGRNRTETGKKPRGEQVKIEKENSHYSVESDSQGSNFVFMQGANSLMSKGRQSRRSANYDGENSDDEAQGREQHFAEELQAGFRKSMAEFEDDSQSYLPADLNWETKGEKNENNGLSADQDPLLESITTLQSAQEALAEELQNFREIGKDEIFFFSDVVQDGSDIVNLKQNVNELESKLEEARSVLKVKESKVIKLETTLSSYASRQKENREIVELEQRNSRDPEMEFENLFKQKIEAMVEYLVISRTNQDLASVNKITFLEEQKTLATEQAQVLNFSKSVGNKASMLKRRVDKLETEIETGEYVKLKKRTCKFASVFFIQFVLLCVALCFFVLQLVPQYTEGVPTDVPT